MILYRFKSLCQHFKLSISIFSTIFLLIGSLTFITLPNNPAHAAAPGLSWVVENFNTASQGNFIYNSLKGRGVAVNSAWTLGQTSTANRHYIWGYSGDKLSYKIVWSMTGSGTINGRIRVNHSTCPGVATGVKKELGNLTRPFINKTFSWDMNVTTNAFCSMVFVFDLNRNNSGWEPHNSTVWAVQFYPVITGSISANTFTNKTVDAGTYLSQSVVNSQANIAPFSNTTSITFPAISSGLGCSGLTCSGSATRAGTYTYKIRNYATKAICTKLVLMGSKGGCYTTTNYTLYDDTKQMVLTVNPAQANINKSGINFNINTGIDGTSTSVSKEKGYAVAEAFWRDTYDNVTTSNIGTISALWTDEMLAHAKIENDNTISFTTTGKLSIAYVLTIGEVSRTINSITLEIISSSNSSSSSSSANSSITNAIPSSSSSPNFAALATTNQPILRTKSGTIYKVMDIAYLSQSRKSDILWMYYQGITSGCSNSKIIGTSTYQSYYCPTQAVNRGAMAQFLYKYAGSSSIRKSPAVFNDIYNLSDQRIAAIYWLSSEKITGSSGKFQPNAKVNRGSMAQFIQKYVKVASGKSSNSSFIDVKSSIISQARIYAINWLFNSGITAGCNVLGNKFCPASAVNRGSMATFFHKIDSFLTKKNSSILTLY